MGRKVKYMGKADIRTVPKGTSFGGQLADPVEADVRFSKENYWTVDSDEAGLSDTAVDLLVETDAFKDVSGMKRIPPNEFQQIYMGMRSVSEEESSLVSDDDPEEATEPDTTTKDS